MKRLIPAMWRRFNGNVSLTSSTGRVYTAVVSIKVSSGQPLVNGGDDQIWRQTRLAWLNSKLGLEDEGQDGHGSAALPPPFTPVRIKDANVGGAFPDNR